MSEDGNNQTGRIGRRNFLKGLGASGVLGLTGLSSGAAASSPDHPAIPKKHLGSDVERLVRVPPKSEYSKQADDANIVAVYKVIREGGKTDYVQIGSGGKAVEFDLLIDEEAETFRVENVGTPDVSEQMQSQATPESVPNSYSTTSLYVAVNSHDGVHYNLCKTRQKLYWLYDGTSAEFSSRSKEEIPVSPTKPGTHWYLESAGWVGDADVIDSGRTVISTNEAHYYNTDMFGGGRTDVDHRLTIEGYRSGDSYYYATVNESGYLHETLHHHTYVM